jgi:hypothetical protein
MPRYISKKSKRSKQSKQSKKSRKSRSKKQYKTAKHKKVHKKVHKKTHSRKLSQNQRGGADCNLATVREPGFNVPALGDITGLSIPESRGVIYRPNCQPDTYQAMTP